MEDKIVIGVWTDNTVDLESLKETSTCWIYSFNFLGSTLDILLIRIWKLLSNNLDINGMNRNFSINLKFIDLNHIQNEELRIKLSFCL